MFFFQKTKNKSVRAVQSSLSSDIEEISADKVTQPRVDVYQTKKSTIVYVQLAGADINDIDVSIEGDANTILIKGKMTRPEYIVFPKNREQGIYLASECVWGDFYRRIILSESVEIEKAAAKIKNGVLILILPLLKLFENKEIRLRAKQSGQRSTSKK